MAEVAHDDRGAVVIVGSGAGGGTLAHELTRRGIRVVLLEAGARQSLGSFSQVPGEAFAQLTWLEPRTVSGSTTIAQDYPTLPSWTCKTVGGTTVHWTGSCPRIRPWEVRARSTYGALPGASLIDWPIEYEELVRYYELAERRMVVARRHGNPGLPASNHFKVMYNGARRIGYRQVHTGYMAINAQPADERAFCIQQGFCVQGCKTGAKWSTLYTEIPRAEATGNLDLRTECRAVRIEHGPDARVSGVVYRDAHGVEQRQKAHLVCVACNSVETARLLLLSESAKFPHGLANSSDQVGRNFCHHTGGFAWGIFDKPIEFWRGATLAGIVEDETLNDPRRGFVGGYHLELAALDLPSLPLSGFPHTMWGRELGFIMDHYRSMAGIFINGEDLPRATNRITLNPAVKDRFGLPVANIHLDDHENNAAMRAHAQRQSKALYEAVGAIRVAYSRQTPATHNMCTARMSRDPKEGVANAHGQTHDIPNLFISDGSAMSTPGSANPTLTIVALALRQAQFIERELRARNI
ncbi:MAG TPA: GMC family oxidoreductase [Steroidobacteraceae bacterium]|nr:GMC family oxidoreductase [Steroidobacteraceae bacterium]